MPPKKDNDSNANNNNNNNSNTSINASPLKQLNNNADVAAAAEQKQALYLANAKLCRLVKRCPWMYDRQHPNYAKKHIMDKSWAKIAKDCDDSIASCKERWRNVRAAFARSINIYKTNSGPNRVKPYYLYNELQFLIKPMMDGRDVGSKEIDEIKSDWDETATTQSMQPDAGANSPPISLAEHTQPEITISDVEAEEFSFPEDEISLIDDAVNSGKITELPQNDTNCTSTSTNVMNSATNTTEINECQTSGYLSHERTTGSSTPLPAKRPKLFHDFSGFLSFNSNDPDAKFLEALLPDMRAMNTRQKIIFKRKIYQSLEEVFETNSDFPAHSARHHNHSHAMDGFVATRSPDNYSNVTQSIDSLRDNEMKKLQEFLQNITRQRSAATTVDRNSPRSLGQPFNGQTPLTVIPRCQTRGVAQQQVSVNLNGSNQSNSNTNSFQPIPLKYEFSENED